jgi:hypothetical protein
VRQLAKRAARDRFSGATLLDDLEERRREASFAIGTPSPRLLTDSGDQEIDEMLVKKPIPLMRATRCSGVVDTSSSDHIVQPTCSSTMMSWWTAQ